MTDPAHDLTYATFDALRARWTFLHDSYLGGEFFRNPSLTTLSDARLRWQEAITEDGGTVVQTRTDRRASYLVPFPAESDRSFDLRRTLASLVNPCEIIVDAYAEGVTCRVTRDLGALTPLLEDADRRGAAWGEVVEEAVRWTCAYGVVAAVVDAPRARPGVETRADEAAAKVRPYVVLVQPTAWAWTAHDADGALAEFAYVEDSFLDPTTPDGSRQCVRLRVWTRAGWQLRAGSVPTGQIGAAREALEVVEGDRLPPVLGGQLPVTFLFHRRLIESRAPRGLSMIDNAADLTRAIYNKRSCEDQIAREAGFPSLAIPMGSTGGHLDPQTKVSIGPSKALPYDSQTGAPSWIQPSAEWARDLRESCVADFQHALRSAGLEMAADQSAQVQSGEALRIRSRDFESRAARLGRNAQRWELATLALYARLAGVAVEPVVTYPSRYTLPDLSADLDRALRLLRDSPVEIGATARLLATQQAIDAAVPLTDAQRAAIGDQLVALLNADTDAFERERAVAAAEAEDKLRKLAPADEPPPPPPSDEPVQLFGYDYEAGIVTVNEARAAKGFGPVPWGEVTVAEHMLKLKAAVATIDARAERATETGAPVAPPPVPDAPADAPQAAS